MKYPWIARAIWCFVALFLGFIGILAWKWNDIPPQIPLFYSLSRGEEQLASPWQLSFLPALSFLLFLLDMIITVSLFDRHKILAALCATIGAIVTLILFMTFIRIILLVS